MKLLLAEDTRDMNRALTAVLSHEGYDVDSVFDGEEALTHIRHDSYDGIILDIMMPKKNGLEVLSEVRAINILTPVLLLTAKAEVDDRVAGLDAGADDYLTKPFAIKELLARVRSMTRRISDYGSQHLTYEDLTLDAETFELSSANAVRLSVKEFALIHTLVLNAGRNLSSKYLLGHVWDQEPDAGEDTVQLYVSYLRDKLKWVGSRVTVTCVAAGYRLQVAGDDK